MNNLIAQLAQPIVWLVPIIATIVVNVVSSFIHSYLDKQASNASSWWRKRSEQRKIDFFETISRIIDHPERQLALQFDELRTRINGGILLALALLFFLYAIIFQIRPSDTAAQSIYTSVGQILFQFAGVVALLVSNREIKKAAYKKHVLTECQRYIDGDIFIHSATYGIEGAANDVSHMVRDAISNGRLRILANNKLGGDAAPDQPKILTVVYSYGGRQATITTPENQWFSFPEA